MRMALELVPTSGGRCLAAASFKKLPGVWAMVFPSNHICRRWGFAKQLPGHELTGVYFNGWLKGFWVEHGAMGSTPMTPVGLKPNFS